MLDGVLNVGQDLHGKCLMNNRIPRRQHFKHQLFVSLTSSNPDEPRKILVFFMALAPLVLLRTHHPTMTPESASGKAALPVVLVVECLVTRFQVSSSAKVPTPLGTFGSF